MPRLAGVICVSTLSDSSNTASAPAAPSLHNADAQQRLIIKFTIALLVLGVAWRVIKYALAMPIWGDEAMLGLNLIGRNPGDLLVPLDRGQVAPVGFLAAELTAIRTLGLSEYAVRLFPLLCGIGALLAFWRLARAVLPPFATLVAVGSFAVGTYMARHAVEFKPYAGDQLAAVMLLYVAVRWYEQRNVRWLLLLTPVAALSLTLSFPAIFVAGGVGIMLLWPVARSRSARSYLLYSLFVVAVVIIFALLLVATVSSQYQASASVMKPYWQASFPPRALWSLAWWLLDIHTGNMLAHPFGGRNFGSAGTLVVCIIGGITLFRRKPLTDVAAPTPAPISSRWLLGLLLAPFALTLIAAAMHRYPYGGSARVAMHLAPAICLLLGLGWATIHARLKPVWRPVLVWSLAVMLLAIGIGGVVYDTLRPYKTRADFEARQAVRNALAAAPHIIVATDPIPPNFHWYLHASGRPFHIRPAGEVTIDQPTVVLCFEQRDAETLRAAMQNQQAKLVSSSEGFYQIGPLEGGPNWCGVTVWTPRGDR